MPPIGPQATAIRKFLKTQLHQYAARTASITDPAQKRGYIATEWKPPKELHEGDYTPAFVTSLAPYTERAAALLDQVPMQNRYNPPSLWGPPGTTYQQRLEPSHPYGDGYLVQAHAGRGRVPVQSTMRTNRRPEHAWATVPPTQDFGT